MKKHLEETIDVLNKEAKELKEIIHALKAEAAELKEINHTLKAEGVELKGILRSASAALQNPLNAVAIAEEAADRAEKSAELAVAASGQSVGES
jgi:regulator of replication initiation timing